MAELASRAETSQPIPVAPHNLAHFKALAEGLSELGHNVLFAPLTQSNDGTGYLQKTGGTEGHGWLDFQVTGPDRNVERFMGTVRAFGQLTSNLPVVGEQADRARQEAVAIILRDARVYHYIPSKYDPRDLT